MADAYRGLVIRIGGDVTELKKALYVAEKAASQTTRELRKIEQGLKMDPSNLELAAKQIGYVGQQAASTAERMAALELSIKKAGEQDFTLKTIDNGEIVESTNRIKQLYEEFKSSEKSIASFYAESTARYNDLSEQLARMNNQVTQVFAGLDDELTEPLRDALSFEGGVVSLKQFEAEVEKLPAVMRPSEEQMEEFRAQVKGLQDDYVNAEKDFKKWVDAQLGEIDKVNKKYEEELSLRKQIYESQVNGKTGEEADKITKEYEESVKVIERAWDEAGRAVKDRYAARIESAQSKATEKQEALNQKFESLKSTLAGIKMPVFNAANNTNDINTLRDSLMAVREQAGLSEEQIDAFINRVKELKQQFAVAKNAQEQAFVLTQYEDAQNELLKTGAALNQIIEKLTQISSKSSISNEWAKEMGLDVKTLDTAIDNTTQRFNALSQAFLKNTQDTDTLRDAANAYAEQISLTTQKVELLQKEMDKYEGSNKGLQQIIEDAGSIELAAERARVKLAEILTELDTKKGKQNSLALEAEQAKNNYESLKVSIVNVKSEEEAVSEEARSMALAMEQAKQTWESSGARSEGMKEEIADLEAKAEEAKEVLDNLNAARELVNLRADTDEAKAALKAYADQARDTIERLNAIGNMSKIQEGNRGLEQMFSTVSKYVDASIQDVTRLNKLLKDNPDNENYYQQMMRNFEEATKGAEGEVSNLQRQLSSFDVEGLDRFFSSEGGIRQVLGEVENMSIGEMFAELSNRANEADQNVIKLQTSLKKLQDDDSGDVGARQIEDAKEQLDAAKAASDTLHEELQKAFEYRRVQELRSELIGAGEDSENLAKIWREMRGIDIRPKLDASFSNELKEKLQHALSDAMGGDGIDSMTSALQRTDAELAALTTRASAFKSAMKSIPDDVDLIAKAEGAVRDELNQTVAKAEELRHAISGFDMDLVDQDSIDMGTVEAKFIEAKEQAEMLVETVQRIEKAILAAEQEMDNMSSAFRSTEEGKRRYEELNEQILDMRDLLRELRSQEGEIFDNAALAKNTKTFVEMQDALAKTDVSAKTLRKELEEIAKKRVEAAVDEKVKSTFEDITASVKKYDSAITDAINKAKQYNEALKSDPTNEEAKAKKAEAIGEALGLAAEKAKMLNQSIGDIGVGMNADIIDQIKGKYDSFGEAVIKTREALESTESELSELAAKVSEFASKSDLGKEWEQSFLDANQAIKKVPPELEEVRQRIVELGSQRPGQALEAWVAAVCDELEKLGVDADTAKAHVQQLVDQMNESPKGTDAGFQQIFTNVIQYAERAASAISESASTIDSAYRDMRKTVNATEAEFEQIRDEAIKFSQTHIVTADQMLEMESLGGQLGLAASELSQFGEIASNLDIATDISADQIALQMGQIKNLMSDIEDMDGMERFADALVRLGNNAAAQESSIMDIAQRIAAVANVTSMTTPEVLAWSAAIAETGMHSESAATSLVKTVTGIGEAVAGGGKQLQAFAEIAGMSAEQFKKAWATSSSDALEAFVKGLAKLTDDSTDAIEALESVGISSVRQETSLLALSQTIGNLDDNLEMSKDAFNGVSDVWGQAGDAAIEAANKSEGFSGSLGILQSNIQNLSASLGDALIPFLDLISTALAGITNVLNALPGPLKSVVVGIGSITAIGGSAINIIDTMIKGFSTLTSSGGAAATMAATLSTKISAMITSLTGAEVAVGALGTAFATGLVGVAVVAIAALITKFAEFIGEMKRAEDAEKSLERAGDELAEAARHSVDAVDSARDSVANFGITAEEVTDKIEEMAGKLDSLRERIEGRRLELDVDLGMLNDAVDVIEKYANSTDLSYDAQADLRIALAQVNDVLGTNLELINGTTGAIKDQGDSSIVTASKIRDMADSYETLKKGEVEVENLEDAYHDLQEAERNLATAKAELDRLQQAQEASAKQNISSTRLEGDAMAQLTSATMKQNGALKEQQRLVDKYQEAYDRTLEIYNELKDVAHETGVAQVVAADDAASAMKGLLETTEAFTQTFDSEGQSIDRFVASLIDLGASTTDLRSLSDAELAALARAYDGSIDSIIEKLRELKIEFSGTMDATASSVNHATSLIASAAATASTATTQSVEEVTDALSSAYDQRKRELDDYYDTEKDMREAYYNARKRQLDAEYNDAKRAYDAEYDALKRALDKEYDTLKSELDKQYTLRKRVLDQEYDDLKNSLDKQYDARKTELDREYDLIKKRYDAEYNAAKKAYDAEYNAAKKAYDAEYNAAKKAYDQQYNARKKSLDAEYNAVKKSLDAEYNARKKELDKEYKAYQKQSQKYLKQYKKQLNEQVTAFKKATDERVEEIKRELKAQQDLIDAETKRKTDDIDARIAALKGETEAMEKEEELRTRNEKIAELERNVAKAKSRRTRAEAQKELSDYLNELALQDAKEQNQILIDQLEEEKDLLEEDAENRKSLLDEQYQAEIDAYKEARAAQLEALQEYLDEVYEREQEAEQERLDAIKERQQAELDGIKEQNNAKLEAIKEQHTAELESLKESQQAELDAIKESNQAKLDTLKENQQAELDALKERQAEALQVVKDNQQAELDTLKEHNEAILQEKKYANEDELQELKDAQQAQLDAQKEANEIALDQMKTDHEIKLEQMKTNHDIELEQLKAGHEEELEAIKANNELELQALKDQNTAKVESMKEGNEEQRATAEEGAKALAEEAKKGAQAAAEQVGKGADDSTEHVRRFRRDGARCLSESIPEFADLTKRQQNAVVAELEPTARKYMKAGQDQMSAWKQAYDEKGPEVLTSLDGTIDKIDKKFDGAAQTIEQKLQNNEGKFSKWSEALKGHGDNTSKNFDSSMTEVEKKAEKTADVVEKKSEKAAQSMEKNSEKAEQSVEKHFDGAAKAVEKSGDDAQTAAEQKWKPAFDNIERESEEAKNAVEANMQDAQNAVSTSAQIAGDLSGMMDSIAPAWEIAGGNAVIGLGNGMWQNAGYVYDTANSIAANAISILNAALEVHSPSRVTKRIGEYVTMGLAVGMEGKRKNVDRIASDIATSLGDDFVDNYLDGMATAKGAIDDCITLFGNRIEENFTSIEQMAERSGYDSMRRFVEGFSSSEVDEQLMEMSHMFQRTMKEISTMTSESGRVIGENLVRGLQDSLPRISGTAQQIADSIAMYLHHSTPDKGSLKDDDEWGSDLVDNIIDGFESKRDQLARQAELLARIVEENFQPEFALEAAQEAAETLQQIQRRYYQESMDQFKEFQSDMLSMQQQMDRRFETGQVGSTNVSISISSLVVREEADVDRIAQELATRVDQITRARLGR